ncbi:MAG: hypothetical protein EXQ95_14280 [Alphaproteobacteria bacterium]|nr:hypothetical protein [Alphaproteobacteria bacterium]
MADPMARREARGQVDAYRAINQPHLRRRVLEPTMARAPSEPENTAFPLTGPGKLKQTLAADRVARSAAYSIAFPRQ